VAATALGYVAMVAATVALFVWIRARGETLSPPATALAAAPSGGGHGGGALLHVLLALAAVIAAGSLLARLFRRFGQPPVIGEVMAGILLGPSLLGPRISGWILPADVAPFLGVIAQLGVILYMFGVGLELNASLLAKRAHAAVAISHASILMPFLLGSALALFLYPRFGAAGVPFTPFALFLGVAMSITAFPVLARILTDRRMSRTPLGVLALGCAATDDVTAWCLLAFVVGVARAEPRAGLTVLLGAAAYAAFMFLVARPLLKRWTLRLREPLSHATIAAVLTALLVSALATEAIGVHAIFGAFLLGAVVPHDGPLARAFSGGFEQIVTALLLPAFFAFTGMRTRIDLLTGGAAWLSCALIVLVATAGKFGGTLAAARWSGLGWRDASALGVLMNTRGLMELIVLNIGLDLGVISPRLFAMMVLMALVTTLATSPILAWLRPAAGGNPEETALASAS
jgi:Kef-type K+ transport system membrane component KefB